MTLKQFTIIYFPFPDSDMTLDASADGADEVDALRNFRLNPRYFGLRVKEVKPK